MLLASLPWYDLREIRHATDALWHLLARNLRKHGFTQVPEALNRRTAYKDQWTSGKLLFSQACGYDILFSFPSDLRMIATPVYTAAGCRGGYYSSMIVVRDDSRFEQVADLRTARCVVNTPDSHSGMNVLRALVAPMHSNGRFFSSVTLSGSHEISLRMIAEGSADVAAIDGVLYALIERHRPQELRRTRVLCCTARMPAPPFVTGSQLTPTDVAEIREALVETLSDPALAAEKEALLLDGIEVLPLDAYYGIAELERGALAVGYSELHHNCRIVAPVRCTTENTAAEYS